MKKDEEFPVYPPLFIVRITEKLRNFFLRLYRRFTHPNVVAWEMVHNLWLAAAIGVVAEIGIADKLKNGSKSIHELAAMTGTHEDSLYRIMRVLASQGIFRDKGDRHFELTNLAGALLEDQVKYLIAIHLTKQHFHLFGELLTCVITGKNASELLAGSKLFEYIGKDEQRNEWYNKAMSNATMMQVSAILSAYSFKKFKRIIDVGGGQGLLLAAILRRSELSSGVIYDLKQSISQARSILEKYSVIDRAEIIEGNFFETIPDGGDMYILKSVLHNWDDESAVRILGNVKEAMNMKSRLLIIESLINKGNLPSAGKMTDILMMVALGGRERTKDEYEALLNRAGLKIRKIHPTISPHSLIEAVKAE